eukprot:1437421-Prymnesium_polylepis.1
MQHRRTRVQQPLPLLSPCLTRLALPLPGSPNLPLPLLASAHRKAVCLAPHRHVLTCSLAP